MQVERKKQSKIVNLKSKIKLTFTAIDFETATAYHPCSVGIVTVENGVIVDEYVTLIQPPRNEYSHFTIAVHGIYPRDTMNAKTFVQVFLKLKNGSKTESLSRTTKVLIEMFWLNQWRFTAWIMKS